MPKRSKEYVSELTCRGIKSSMNDPIKLISFGQSLQPFAA